MERLKALLRRLKAKHWDEGEPGFEFSGNVGIATRGRVPPLRRAARWFAAQWEKHPAAWIAAGVAVCALILQLLRRG